MDDARMTVDDVIARLRTVRVVADSGVKAALAGTDERGRMVSVRSQVDDLLAALPGLLATGTSPGAQAQDAERLAARLEHAARSIRDSIKPPQRGVFLHRARMGHTVNVDGLDLGLDTSWSDADALCKAIATRRPPGDEMGYGKNYDSSRPTGTRPPDLAYLGLSLRTGPG
jgi:hypothetical protein